MCVWSFCLWLHPQAEKDRFGKHEHETQVWPYMVKPPFHSVLCAMRPFTQWGQSLTTHAFMGEVCLCLITSVKHFLLNLVLPRCRRGKKALFCHIISCPTQSLSSDRFNTHHRCVQSGWTSSEIRGNRFLKITECTVLYFIYLWYWIAPKLFPICGRLSIYCLSQL